MMSFTKKVDLFRHIRLTRPHICEVCWKRIKEAQTRCFSHIVDISWSKANKFNPNNIALVCSIACHGEVDKLCKGKRDLILKILDTWIKPLLANISQL